MNLSIIINRRAQANGTRRAYPVRGQGGRVRRWQVSASALALSMGLVAPASGQVSQSLGYDWNASSFETLLAARHTVQGMSAGPISVSFNQSASYSVDQARFREYSAGLDINDDQNFFASLTSTLAPERRGLGGFVDNRFERGAFTLGVSGNGSVDWNRSTFGDEGLFDPDFDFFEHTQEELDAIVWVRAHFAEGSFDLDVKQRKLGRVNLRPGAQARVSRSDFGGLSYSFGGALGLSLNSGEDDEFAFFFEESNLTAEVLGGSFGAGDGELVLAGGYDGAGQSKFAALFFKRWNPTARMSYTFDANAAMVYRTDEGLSFADGSVRLGANLQLNQDFSLDGSGTVMFVPERSPNYSVSASANFTRFASFAPFIRLSGTYEDGWQSISVPVGFNGDAFGRLQYSGEISPSYSGFDGSTAVMGTAQVTLLGPPLRKDGQNSEFTVSGSADLRGEERSISVSGRFYF